jgi:hypothetical protein
MLPSDATGLERHILPEVYQINISNQERVHPHRWEIFAQ